MNFITTMKGSGFYLVGVLLPS